MKKTFLLFTCFTLGSMAFNTAIAQTTGRDAEKPKPVLASNDIQVPAKPVLPESKTDLVPAPMPGMNTATMPARSVTTESTASTRPAIEGTGSKSIILDEKIDKGLPQTNRDKPKQETFNESMRSPVLKATAPDAKNSQ